MNRKSLLLSTLLAFLFCFQAKSQCPDNVDFEAGTPAFWNFYNGTCCPINTPTAVTATPGRHEVVSGSAFVDPFGGFPIVAPGGGIYSLKLGNSGTGAQAEKARYFVRVPTGSTDFSLIYKYAVVLENPAGHSSGQQPVFQVKATDSATGIDIPCEIYNYVSSSSLPGFSASSTRSSTYYKPWTSASINLSAHAGRTVAIDFASGDCSLSGHFGYGYVDMQCGIFSISVVGCSSTTATLTAPPGYSSYRWCDSVTYGTTYGTTMTSTIPVPTVTTTYAVILGPYSGFGCPDTLYAKLIPSNLNTRRTNDTAFCLGGTVRMSPRATDSLSLRYSWSPSSTLDCSTCDTVTATPTVGVTAYTVTTTNSGGCLRRDTITVTVYPNPTTITGTLSVCLGLTTTLSNGVAGGRWRSGDTSRVRIDSVSGIALGASVGTALVTYSFGGGMCAITTTVTVNPLPTSILGTRSVCMGLTTTLSDLTAGGTWSSGTLTTATIGSSTGIVTGVTPGTTIITYRLTSTSCITTATVLVNPLPLPIAGITSFCAGTTSTLANVGGGTWSSSTSSVATIGSSSGVVYGVSAGTSMITYTLPGTGCIITTPVTILFQPLPIAGVRSVCQGNTTSLSSPTVGGTWSSADISLATVGVGTGVVTGVYPGTVTITYHFSGCYTASTVTVNPIPASIIGGTSICLGATSTLVNPTAGGVWSSSSPTIATIGSSSGIVTGLSLGTSLITYRLPTGCLTTTTVTIHRVPGPITGTPIVCSGITTTLSDTSLGGIWSSSNPTVASIGSSSGIVTGLGTGGTVTIRYTFTVGGCFSSITVTVNPTPPAIAGSSSVCVGDRTTLSNTSGGGIWISSNMSVATIGSSSGEAWGVAVGTSVITYRLPTGCQITRTLTVNPIPGALSGITTICAGARTTLSSSTSGGNWVSGTTSVATVGAGTGIVYGVSAGTTVITYRIFTTGCFVTTTVTITPPPGPMTGPAVFCTGNRITLTNSVAGGVWSSTNTAVASIGSSTGIVDPISVGTSTISYSLGATCSVSMTVTVNQTPAPITGLTSLCVGSVSTLSTTTTGGTWSMPATPIATLSSGGILYGGVPGSTMVTYTGPSGCIVTASVTVTTGPSAIAGPLGVCPSATATLVSATGGGTWSSSNTTVATINTTSGVMYGIIPGTTIITYSLGSSCYITRTTTVYTLPTAIAGPSSVCLGSSITLSGPGAGTWSSTTATVGLSSGIVTGTVAGVATITFTLTSTGCSATATVMVNPLPAAIGGPSAVCVGANITLTNSGTGAWSITPTTIATIDASTGVVTGVSIGTARVTFTLPTGCITTTTISVSPTPTAILGGTSLCVGTSVTISNAVAGGVWSSSNLSVATIGSLAGDVYGLVAGTTIVSYSLGSGCTVTATITVNPLPSPISGATSMCIGSSVSLSDATAGGVWSSSSSSIASVNSSTGMVHGLSPGTATITYSLGCIVTITVTVNPTPSAIAGFALICANETTTFSNTVSGGTWSSSNISRATVDATSGVVYGVSGGSATITYSLGGSCIATRSVQVNPIGPIMGNTNICVGLYSTLSNAISGGVWTSSTLPVATIGVSSGIAGGVSAGTTTITYRLTTGCQDTAVLTVNTVPVAITGPLGICQGTTATLINTTAGGSWISASSSIATIETTTGIVTGVFRGTSTITYSLGSGCTVTAVLTVHPLPNSILGSSNLCVGTSITVSSASVGGTWLSSDPTIATTGSSSVGVIGGVSAGTVSITYTLPTGCTTTRVFTVNPLPSAILGNPTMCVGTSTTVSNTDAGGVWSSGTTGVASINASSGVINGITAGTSNISYRFTTTGCIATTVATVIALPPPISGPSRVCIGTLVTMSNTTAGGTWVSGHTPTASIDPITGVLTGHASGTVIISYTVGTGCRVITNVIVNPLSPIVGDSIVCVNQCITLTDSTEYGTWSSSNPAVATAAFVSGTAGRVCGVSGGVVTVTYTLGSGCRAFHTVSVLPAPAPIGGPSSVCQTQNITLTHALPGFTWLSNDPLIASIDASTGVVTGAAPGVTTISYLLPSGCPALKAITVNPLPGDIHGVTDICQGSTVTLSDPLFGGGTWTSSAGGIAPVGFTTGIVTGRAVGTATISYTLSTGCASQVDVNVIPLPLPITGSGNLCIGSVSTLSNATAGGYWTSSDPMIASIDYTTGVVTGLSTGTVVIRYTVSATGCYVDFPLIVNALPPSILGSPNVCVGGTTTLSSVATGGTWVSGDITLAGIGITSGIASGVAPGVVPITYTLGTGCATVANINVNPLPDPITGSPNICVGMSTTLFNTATGGTWVSSSTGTARAGLTTGIITGVAPGAAIITYTLPTTCSITQTVNVSPLPTSIFGPSDVCMGNTTTFTNGVAGGAWVSSDATILSIGSATGAVSGVSIGAVVVSYSIGSACVVTKFVNVLPLPVAYTVTGGGNYCAGGSGRHIYLSGSQIGTNYMLYRGSTPTGAFSGTGGAIDLGSQTVGGTYYVVATSASTLCSRTMTGTATIVVDPTIIPTVGIAATPADTVCEGTSVTFTSVPVNGGSSPMFEWTVNGVYVGSGSSYSFIPYDRDRVHVWMRSNANCVSPDTTSSTKVMNVITYQTPVAHIDATPSDTICKGDAVTLLATNEYGGTSPVYMWMINGAFSGTGPSYSYMPTNGDYVYARMSSNFMCRLEDTVVSGALMITVDTPIVPIVNIEGKYMTWFGQPDTLHANVINGGDAPIYQWVINGRPIAGATNATYIGSSFQNNDSVSCRVTNSYFCPVTGHNWVYMLVSPLGAGNVLPSAGALQVIPNPNHGVFTIKGTIGSSVQDLPVSLEITNLLGQVVYTQQLTAKNGVINERIVPGNTLANGMYLLNINADGFNKVFHIVVEQ